MSSDETDSHESTAAPLVELRDYATKRRLDLGVYLAAREASASLDESSFAHDVLIRLRFNGDDVARAVRRSLLRIEHNNALSG